MTSSTDPIDLLCHEAWPEYDERASASSFERELDSVRTPAPDPDEAPWNQLVRACVQRLVAAGASVPYVASRLGVTITTIYVWLSVPSSGPPTPQMRELVRDTYRLAEKGETIPGIAAELGVSMEMAGLLVRVAYAER